MEGGPKVAELSEDLVDSKRLIEALNINAELLAVERDRIQEVIIKNHRAFGLDHRLGHLDHAIHIPLKPGAKEIFFHLSMLLWPTEKLSINKWINGFS